jgi:hypothetical protein
VWRRADYEALFGAAAAVLRGESTPFYLYDRAAQPRIRALVPAARLIVILRDPVERAHRLCPRRRHGDDRMAGLGHQGGRIGPTGFEDHAGTIGQLRESALPIPRAGCGSGGPGRWPPDGLAAPWPGIRRALTGSGPSATEIFRFIG